MRRLSSVAVLSLLFLSTPVLAESPASQEASSPSLVPVEVSAPALVHLPPVADLQVSTPATVEAPAPLPVSLEQLLPLVVQLAASGQWVALVLALVLGAVLVLATVGGVRAFLGQWVPWLKEDRAGVVLSGLAGALGSVVVAVVSGTPFSVSLVLGFLSSLLASGAWSWQRKARSAAAAPFCTADDIANGKAGC